MYSKMYIESNVYNILTLCIIYMNIIEISPSSIITHWKLNHNSGKIEKSLLLVKLLFTKYYLLSW